MFFSFRSVFLPPFSASFDCLALLRFTLIRFDLVGCGIF